jgi:O-antigen/teichoic acid export membrane protein
MTFYASGNAAGSRELLIEALRWMTVYEGANAATPRNRLQRMVKRNGDLLSNSGALMATSVMTSLLGFVYWWVAARSFPSEAVGAASAAISAMTLIGTLGMFGMGTLLISELPRAKSGQWSLISTCVLVAATVSAVGALVYVVLSLFVIHGLRASLGSPLGTVLLVVAICLNGAMLVLDEGLVGLLAGHLQLLRNAYFAVGKLVMIVILALLPVAVTGSSVLATWVAGMVLSLVFISVSLRSRGAGPIRPRLSAIRGLARQAMDHNLLNVALFLPRICLPLVVTSVVSTRATAAFYTAWMVVAFLAMIPGSIATTLFAVASGDSAALRAKVRIGLVIALGLGIPLSSGIALLARPIMGLFGESYAATAGAALSILAPTYAAGVMRQFYVTISRLSRRTGRASFFAIVMGVVELCAAWAGGRHAGLTGLVTWLAVVMVAEGLVMAPPVLRVALARAVPASGGAPATGGAAEADGALPADRMAAQGGAAGHAVPKHAARHRRARAGRTPAAPRVRTPEPARSRADETMIIARQVADETMVMPRVRADDTVVVPRRDLDTVLFERPAVDDTTDPPRTLDAPAVASTVDSLAETRLVPRVAAEQELDAYFLPGQRIAGQRTRGQP